MWRKSQRNLGHLLLAVWLILVGMGRALDLSFHGSDLLSGVLAVAAGAALLLGR